MSFNEFLTYFFLFFLVLGAIDKCLDNKFGLGKGFEDAWGTATTLILVMIGINSFAPLIGQWLQPVLTPVFHAIGADPSAIAGLLIPGDSGGYFLAMELCESEAAGCYQGLLVSFITGCIMIFTLPVGFASIQKDRQDLVVRGVLYGIITSPIGLIFGGLFSGLSIWEWFCNSIPVLIISLILIVCMLFWQKQLIRFMMISSRILNAILIVLLVIAIFDAKLDFFHIEGLVSFDDGLLIIGSILIFLAGAFPFLNFIRLVFKKPLKRLADKTFLDVEWEFIKGETSDPLVKEYLSRSSQNENDILTVIICMPTDDQALTVSTNLPQAVYDKAEQILVYQRHSQDMILQLSAAGIEDKSVRKKNRYQKVVAFGELIHCFDQSLVDVPFAKKINSNNQKQIAQRIAEGKDWREIDLKWCNLKLLERWSAIYSSHGWWSRFRTMGIAPGQTPQKELFEEYFQQNEHTKMLYCRVEHNRWNMERLLKVGDCLLTDAHYEEWSAQSALPEKGSPRDQFKKALKDGPTREHLDLCSFWQLCVKDSGTIKYDLNRNERLVGIYEALF